MGKYCLLSAVFLLGTVFGLEKGDTYHLANGTHTPKFSSVNDFIHLIANKKRRLSLSRKNDNPEGLTNDEKDLYLEGYIQSLIDSNYYEYNVLVYVKDKKVFLFNMPKNRQLFESIKSYVEELPDVDSVEIGTKIPDKELEIQENFEVRSQIRGVWFPSSTVLFQPLVAAPREPGYSLGYRMGDQVLGNQAFEFSLGDIFPVFRWTNVFDSHMDMQFDVVGCMWAVFNMWGNNFPNNEISELVTSDYMGALCLSAAFDQWSFRLRGYHVSSHLGDEYMVNHPDVQRVNPSFEAIDFFGSYQLTEGLRFYAGPGWIVQSDKSFPLQNFYIEWGGELRLLGSKSFYHKLYGTPFLAMNFRNWQVRNWKLDATYALGYEWSRLKGVGRKFRIYGEYHNGYSEGQFFYQDTSYGVIKISYGF